MSERRPSCAELLQNDHMAEWKSAFGWQKEPPLLLFFADIEDDEQIPRILKGPIQLVIGHAKQLLRTFHDLSWKLLRRYGWFAHRSPYRHPSVSRRVCSEKSRLRVACGMDECDLHHLSVTASPRYSPLSSGR